MTEADLDNHVLNAVARLGLTGMATDDDALLMQRLWSDRAHLIRALEQIEAWDITQAWDVTDPDALTVDRAVMIATAVLEEHRCGGD